MALTTLTGCSLLEVKIDNQTTPLTQQELATRLLTREYARSFFSQVEHTADTLSEQYQPDDRYHQSYVLLWKINAQEGLQSAVYQASPQAGLIDSWLFTQQMTDFFTSGSGSELFDSKLARQASEELLAEIEQLASLMLSSQLFKSSQSFIADFSQKNPFTEIRFIQTPSYSHWLKYNDISSVKAISSVGTTAESMADASDRLSLISQQTPKLIGWKAELVALNSDLTSQDVSTALESLKDTSASIQDFVENNAEYMQHLAAFMAVELEPLVQDIDLKTSQQLVKLSKERQALELMVERERIELLAMVERERNAIGDIVSRQRQMLTQELDVISQDVITLAMDKLIELIKSILLYVVLFIVTIFFAPLGLGYMLGKRSAIKVSQQ
ncbi:chemotaxis protein [Vibrio sp. FNV 38]|nr:chemotaxis protein [Vibrio sp. FNV 38]